MKKLIFAISLLLLCSNELRAQILWNLQDTAQAAQGYQYKLYVTPPNATAPASILTLVSVTCTPSTGTSFPTDCTAPIEQAATVGATMPGFKSELTTIDANNGFAESPKSIPFIMQPVDCSATMPVKINVGSWTKSIPSGGVGQVLYNLRQSTSNIIQVVVIFNTVVQDTLQGTKLNNVAGSYFVANVPAGSYQLTVEATDNNGCKAGGASRPMTVNVK